MLWLAGGIMALSIIEPASRSRPESVRPDVPPTLDQALAAICRLAGASGLDLLTYDRETEAISPSWSTGGDPASAAFAIQAAARINAAFMLPGRSPRWIEEPGFSAGARLLVEIVERPGETLFLVLRFQDGSSVARARVMRLLPELLILIRFHIGSNSRSLDLEEVRHAAAAALDQSECGVIAVRADHSIVLANAAASAHLQQGTGLRLRRGVLRPADAASMVRFEAALDSVIDPPGNAQPRRERANVLLLPGNDETGRTIVVIAPILGAALPKEETRGAAAIVYVLQPSQGVVRGLEALCQLHGLSRVESCLIGHLVGGLTISEAAAQMRIKPETARTYLKQIFAKTGMHRQTDLVAMMTRYLRAVRGDFDFRAA